MRSTAFIAPASGLALVLAFALPVQGAEEKAQTYAVLIGISAYADKQILPRPGAEAEAASLYDLLTSKDHLGVNADHIRLLLGNPDAKRPSAKATRDNIVEALRWAATQAAADDLVLFAFIGQGAPLGENTCYFASDSTFRERSKDALAAAALEEELDKLKSNHLCALIDVNFNGFDAGNAPRPELDDENLGKEFLGKQLQRYPAGRVVLQSGGKLENFIQIMLDGLKGAADKEGDEPDGLVTAAELADYLEKELRALTHKQGRIKDGNHSFPHALKAGSTHFALTRNPAVYLQTQRRLEKLEELARDKKLPSDLLLEGPGLLQRMPRLNAARSLRKNYQKLADGSLSSSDFLAERTRILDSRKLEKVRALDFATQLAQAVDTLAGRYYRELDQDEMLTWGIQGLYMVAEEKIPEAIQGRMGTITTLEFIKKFEVLVDAREQLGRREDLEDHRDIDQTLQHIFDHLDRYTILMDSAAMARLRWLQNSATQGEIGLHVRYHPRSDVLEVVTPYKDSPARKAGIQAGDVITQVKFFEGADGKPLDEPKVVVPKALSQQEIDRVLRGRLDSRVEITITREEAARPLVFDITRGRVKKEKISGLQRQADERWEFRLDERDKIYYVRVLDFFSPETARDLAQLLASFEKQGVQGLVLDLRFNPGGLIQTAVEIADLFIDDGLIVEFRSRRGNPLRHTGKSKGSFLKFPVACLINPVSGSSTEIVAACLQDHRRALIVGERTFGKGSVQNYFPVDRGTLRITTAHGYRPNGKPLEKPTSQGREKDDWGVTPDQGYALHLSKQERAKLNVALSEKLIIPRRHRPQKDARPEFKDRQLELALDYLRAKIKDASSKP